MQQGELMFCRYCGADNLNDAIFCGSCGKSVGTMSQMQVTLISAPSSAPLVQRTKSWRKVLTVLSFIGVTFLLLVIWGGYSYVTRSTPTKTLSDFCSALKSQDLQTAYNQLASSNKSGLSETDYARTVQQSISSRGGVIDCAVSSVNESESSATGMITDTYGNGQMIRAYFTLTDENGIWKISNTTPIS